MSNGIVLPQRRKLLDQVNAPKLSALEGAILAAVANGDSTKEIAHAMNTSHDTIDRALRKARNRFDAKNTTALVAICLRKGILK